MTGQGPAATVEAMARSYLRRVATRFMPLWVTVAAVAGTLLLVPPVSDTSADDAEATMAPSTTGRRASEVPLSPTRDELPAVPFRGAQPPGAVFTPVDPSAVRAAPLAPRPASAPDAPDDGGATSLSVTHAVWASRSGGTPLADVGVPAGSLPVGQRGGVTDKATFVRLQGDGTALTLAENPGGRRNAIGEAAVEACRITEQAWEGSEGMPLGDAPQWDPQSCVRGTTSPSGAWVFDLAAFETVIDDRGFALVPAADTIDFQVTFTLDA